MRRGFLTDFETKKKCRRSSAELRVCDNAQEDVTQWASKTNMDSLMVERFIRCQELRARSQKLIFHKIKLNGFQGMMLLDETVLHLLPAGPFVPPHTLHQNSFEISPTTSKGFGMFATRDITVGEIIHAENPAVVVYPFVILNFNMTKSEIYRTLFGHLNQPIRDQLLTLDNCMPSTACNVEEGIVCSNGFAITLPVPATYHAPESLHSGVFLDISRCNHRYARYQYLSTEQILTL